MYVRGPHAELDLPFLRQFIRENPLGIITTAIPSSSHHLLQSSHIPWILDFEESDDLCELGRLRGHMNRQNPQAKAMMESLTSESSDVPKTYLEEQVLILFNGPVDHYITPKFYTETKPASGKVVPTWDYSAVQVYGIARIYSDTQSEEFSNFLSQQLSDLSHHTETTIMGYGQAGKPEPWEVSDAPSPYIDLLKKSLVGIQVEIKSMAGKLKLSQEKIKGDRDGVINGLESIGTPQAAQIADSVRKQAVIYDIRKEKK